MAFRLRSDESVSDGLRRLARKNLRAAGVELEQAAESQDGAVHDARKRVKKVRAILYLVRKDRGRRLKRSRKTLRKVNRQLSGIRDAEATLEVLDSLRKASGEAISEHSFARIRRLLTEHRDELVREAQRDGLLAEAATSLRKVRKQAKRWTTRHDDFAPIERGVRAAHRRARAAMQTALESDRGDDFHAWRKAMKTLWYQLRLLAAAGGRVQKDIATLNAAERMLGDDHNVEVLCGHFSQRSDALSQPELDALRTAAAAYQRTLRRKAAAKARPIFNDTSKAYVRRIETAWKRWRRPPASSRRHRATAA